TIISSVAVSMSVTMLLPMSSLYLIRRRPLLFFFRKAPALRAIFFAKSRGCMATRDSIPAPGCQRLPVGGAPATIPADARHLERGCHCRQPDALLAQLLEDDAAHPV